MNKPVLLVTMVAGLVCFGGQSSRGAAAKGDRSAPPLQYRDMGIIRGPTSAKRLALAFTGHGFAEGGEVILDELSKHHAHSSFFLTGDFLTNPEFAPLIRRLVREGHYLGPHSDKHVLYCSWEEPPKTLVSHAEFESDLENNLRKIDGFGVKRSQVRYFLPAYEHYNAQIVEWAKDMGLTLVNYTPGTRSNADYTGEADKNFVPTKVIFDSITAREQKDPNGLNGFILLLHIGSGPGRTDKFAARFGELLDYLAGKGYEFVRVDNLLEPEPNAFIRANQLGYLPRDTKSAIAFAHSPLPESFSLVAVETDKVVFTGRAKPLTDCEWDQFENHAELDFSAVRAPGRYVLKIGDSTSLPFAISEVAYRELPGQLLEFMREQRCGYNPWLDAVCHPFDGRTAYGPLTNGTYLDARGGWHDAADLLKYLLTSGNATAQMLLAYELEGPGRGSRSKESLSRGERLRAPKDSSVFRGVLRDAVEDDNRISRSVWSARGLPPLSDDSRTQTAAASRTHSKRFATTDAAGAGELFPDDVNALGQPGANGIPDVLDEARWGLQWMLKLHPAPDQLYHQVADDRDHIGRRLPQNEIADYGWGKGGARAVYFADGRPQGLRQYKSESTGVANLAGRYAAAMALACQIWQDDPRQRPFAEHCLQAGREVYELGRAKEGVQQGNSYSAPYRYEETTWADDMEWGAAELFRATGERRYLEEARHYARLAAAESWMGKEQTKHYQYYPFINVGHFRLYDLVDSQFKKLLAGCYRDGIERCVRAGRRNPYRIGVPFIWCSNNLTVALATQCLLYERMAGDRRYHEFAAEQRDWLLGRNPWGYTMFTEIGSVCPKDPHLMTMQLTKRPVRGGLVDGPVYDRIFKSLKGVAITEPDPLAPFQGAAVYHDDVQDYSSNEPTMDGTASAILLWALCSAANP